MRIRNAVRAAGVTAGLMTMTAVLVPGTASAQSTAVLCALRATTVTPAGDNKEFTVYATTPPQASEPEVAPKDLYPDGTVRLGSSLGFEIVTPYGYKSRRYLVLGTDMYASNYTTDGGPGTVPGSVSLQKIGGGWGVDYVYFEQSHYFEGSAYSRTNHYALRNSGELIRWTGAWGNRQTTTALPAGIKTMTLISQTRTYDTFLANTAAGGLYTVRVPTTSPLVPVVKLVRASTWQGFETMISAKCGRQSTLLLGVDKETGSGYLYAVSKAAGTSTLIQGLGKVTGNFNDPFYARKFQDTPEEGNLNGE